MQKMMEFYHEKKIDMLKLGCTLPNGALLCLHKSTNNKIYLFAEAGKDLHDKIHKYMAGGPSIVFTRKALFDRAHIWNSKNICESILGTDASQIYPISNFRKWPLGFTL